MTRQSRLKSHLCFTAMLCARVGPVLHGGQGRTSRGVSTREHLLNYSAQSILAATTPSWGVQPLLGGGQEVPKKNARSP